MAGYSSPQDKAGDQLKVLGFVKGTSGNYYYPENHPHVHIGLGKGTAFMAYSEGKQHLGGGGLRMYQDRKLENYKLGVEKMQAEYPDKTKVGDVLTEAVAILNTYVQK